MKNTIAIIQARTNSKRLPGKILKKINNKSLISWVVENTIKVRNLKKIIIATTKNRSDDKLVDIIKSNYNFLDIYRGNANNVLKRFYNCSLKYKPKYIIRITADDPLKDHNLIKKALKIIKKTNCDYCSNSIIQTYPDGADVEVFKFSALKKTYKEAMLKIDKEHVTSYMIRNSSKFKLYNFKSKKNLKNYRFTVDTAKDLRFIKLLFKHIKNITNLNFVEITKIISKKKFLLKFMDKKKHNYSYYKQLALYKNAK